MTEILVVSLVAIYFAAWVIGVVEGFLFGRYLRKFHPELAVEHSPSWFESSISRQLNTMRWLQRRDYRLENDSELTARADRHRKVSGIAFSIVVFGLTCIFVYAITKH